jgi:hypothetical protein
MQLNLTKIKVWLAFFRLELKVIISPTYCFVNLTLAEMAAEEMSS